MKKVTTLSKDEWDNLRYPIQLEQLSEEAGGGWMAWIPLLGRGAFMVDAETELEAIHELEELRKSRYDLVIASGQPIPVPDDDAEEDAMPSGKWLFRTTPLLHRRLQEAAEAQKISLNAYCNQVLERSIATDTMGSMVNMLQMLGDAIKTNAHMLEESNRKAREFSLPESIWQRLSISADTLLATHPPRGFDNRISESDRPVYQRALALMASSVVLPAKPINQSREPAIYSEVGGQKLQSA